MKLSVSLPSIFPDALGRALSGLARRTRSDYEVICSAPFAVTGPCVTWLPEPEPLGSSGAQAVAAHHFTGDLCVALSDDRHVSDGWDAAVIENFVRRENDFRGTGGTGPFCLGLRHAETGPPIGTVFGHHYAAFPVMRRADVERYGWYDPAFRSGWGDADLGLRLWANGGRVEWTEQCVIRACPDGTQRGRLICRADEALFVDRWTGRFGQGWSTGSVQMFNINVVPEQVPHLITGNTFCCSDPSFADQTVELAPPRLIDTIGETNLVEYRRKVFAIPQRIGAVNLELGNATDHPEIMPFDTVSAALQALA